MLNRHRLGGIYDMHFTAPLPACSIARRRQASVRFGPVREAARC